MASEVYNAREGGMHLLNVIRRGNERGNIEKALSGATLSVSDTIPGGGMAAYRNGTVYVKPDVMEAIQRLQDGNGNGEDAAKLATLFHEVSHAESDLKKSIKQVGGYRLDGKDSGNTSLEVMNEIRSRILLPQFAEKLGIRSMPQPDYGKRQTGYDYHIKALYAITDALGIKRSDVNNDIATSKEHSSAEMARILTKRGGIKESNAKHIVRNMFGYGVEWYDDVDAAVAMRYGKGTKVKAAQRKEALSAMFGADYPNLTKWYSKEVALDFIKKGRKKGTL